MANEEKIKEAANEIGPLLSKYQEEGFSVLNLLVYKNFSIFGLGGTRRDIVKALLNAIKNDKDLREIWEIVTVKLLEEQNREEEEGPPYTISFSPNPTVN